MKKWINFISTAVILAGSTCAGATIIQETDSGKLKAQLNNVQLTDIVNYVKDKFGVTFKGDTSALQTPVTVSFDNLDLENMLKRVLVRKNFFIVYNKHGEVVEVHLLPGASGTGSGPGTGKFDQLLSQKSRKQVHNESEFPPGIFRANGTTADGLYPNAYAFNALGEDKKNNQEDEITKFKIDPQAQDKITSFKINPNAPADEITRFKVDPNTPEKDPRFKVVPNVSPPSGAPDSSDSKKEVAPKN